MSKDKEHLQPIVNLPNLTNQAINHLELIPVADILLLITTFERLSGVHLSNKPYLLVVV